MQRKAFQSVKKLREHLREFIVAYNKYSAKPPQVSFFRITTSPSSIDKLLRGSLQNGTPYTWILTALSFGALTLLGCICGRLAYRSRIAPPLIKHI